jgi:hypothetical protein
MANPQLKSLTHQPTILLHFTQLNSIQLAWGPRYLASERTQQKTLPLAVLVLLLWAVA